MAHLLGAILFSFSSNLDNIVIGLAYGIKKIRIGILSNLLIAAITVTGTFLSMFAGRMVSGWISPGLAGTLGSLIIMLLGLYFMLQSVRNIVSKSKRNNSVALKDSDDMEQYAQNSDKDVSGHIGLKEAVAVGLGLSFNNIGTGIAASASGVGITETVIFTFLFSVLFIPLGVSLGKNLLGKFLGKFAPFISGLLLMALGVIELLW